MLRSIRWSDVAGSIANLVIFLMLTFWALGCSDDNPIAVEPVEEVAFDLEAELIGSWDFVINNRGEALNVNYTFATQTYSYTVRHDDELVWGESGLWVVYRSIDDPNIGTLILHSQSTTNPIWEGEVERERVEVRGNFIWIGSNGGFRQ